MHIPSPSPLGALLGKLTFVNTAKIFGMTHYAMLQVALYFLGCAHGLKRNKKQKVTFSMGLMRTLTGNYISNFKTLLGTHTNVKSSSLVALFHRTRYYFQSNVFYRERELISLVYQFVYRRSDGWCTN